MYRAVQLRCDLAALLDANARAGENRARRRRPKLGVPFADNGAESEMHSNPLPTAGTHAGVVLVSHRPLWLPLADKIREKLGVRFADNGAEREMDNNPAHCRYTESCLYRIDCYLSLIHI